MCISELIKLVTISSRSMCKDAAQPQPLAGAPRVEITLVQLTTHVGLIDFRAKLDIRTKLLDVLSAGPCLQARGAGKHADDHSGTLAAAIPYVTGWH